MTLLAAALRDPVPGASVAGRIPWWTWSGILFGTLFIRLAILLVPKLGAPTFFALLVTGARCSPRWRSIRPACLASRSGP
jgi:transporter family-2 protein